MTMAESMKLRVTAEGVETLDQLEFLRTEKCDEVQGFHVSRPMSAEDAGRYLGGLGDAEALAS